MTEQELTRLIAEGEGPYLEFKRGRMIHYISTEDQTISG